MRTSTLRSTALSRTLGVAVLAAAAFALAGCGTVKKDNRDAETMYNDAMEDFNTSSWDAAVKGFQAIEARYPFGRIAQQSQINEAYALWKQGDSEKAIDTIDRFMKQYPDHQLVDYMIYLRGLVNFTNKIGFFGYLSQQDPSERDPKALRDSYDSFRELLDRFPESKYAEDSRLRASYLIDLMAAYEVHVARYYYRRGAWLAAANRAQCAIKLYNGAKPTEEALAIMVASYDKLGLTQLRDDAHRLLDTNFPNTRYRDNQNLGEPATKWWKFW
ncbi:outer membrane protein assembly factor BamD [soil metagenome]